MKKVLSVCAALLIVMLSVIPAFAVDSPVASSLKYDVIINQTTGGNGSYEIESNINENGEEVISIIAKPNSGYTFDHWDINGAYTTNNKLTDSTMHLVITSDITATPYFKASGSSQVETGTVNQDHSGTSPQTGYNDFVPFAIILTCLAAGGFAAFRLVKSK